MASLLLKDFLHPDLVTNASEIDPCQFSPHTEANIIYFSGFGIGIEFETERFVVTQIAKQVKGTMSTQHFHRE